jgi:hypothetical protein
VAGAQHAKEATGEDKRNDYRTIQMTQKSSKNKRKGE